MLTAVLNEGLCLYTMSSHPSSACSLHCKKSTCMPVITSSTLWAAAQPDSAKVDSHSPHQARSCHLCIVRSQPSARRLSSKTAQQCEGSHTQEARTCKHECTRRVGSRFSGGRLNNAAPKLALAPFVADPRRDISGPSLRDKKVGCIPIATVWHKNGATRSASKRSGIARGQQGPPPTTRMFPSR